MSNTLELSELFVCLGQLIKFFNASGDRKIAELWFARGISTLAGTMVCILVFLLGRIGEALPPAENLFIPPTWENPPSRPSPNKFLSFKFKLRCARVEVDKIYKVTLGGAQTCSVVNIQVQLCVLWCDFLCKHWLYRLFLVRLASSVE